MSDLFENVFQILPAFLEGVCEEAQVVWMVEGNVDSGREVFIGKFNVVWLWNGESLFQELVDGFVLEG